LEETAAEPALFYFRIEFEKLYKTLRTNYDSERRVMKRCKELIRDIIEKVGKTQIALK